MNYSDTEDEVAAAERSSALDRARSAARRFPDRVTDGKQNG